MKTNPEPLEVIETKEQMLDRIEQQVLRMIRDLGHFDVLKGERVTVDPRWLGIARTHIEQGFMALRRAIQ
jgi:hypothetical protein